MVLVEVRDVVVVLGFDEETSSALHEYGRLSAFMNVNAPFVCRRIMPLCDGTSVNIKWRILQRKKVKDKKIIPTSFRATLV